MVIPDPIKDANICVRTGWEHSLVFSGWYIIYTYEAGNIHSVEYPIYREQRVLSPHWSPYCRDNFTYEPIGNSYDISELLNRLTHNDLCDLSILEYLTQLGYKVSHKKRLWWLLRPEWTYLSFWKC